MGATVGTATILFSDIVASTEIRSALGDAAAEQLRRRHDRVLRGVVEGHGGTLVKGLGDGLMATFGGSAEAVEAAVDMQRAIDREWRRAPDGERISIRIGLSAGDVTWEDDDCHGTPVVTAARLCDAAGPAEVLCDDLVRGLARGRVELSFTAAGELELKGLSDPVVAYRVPWAEEQLALSALPGPLRPVPGERPFAGRNEERTRLAELWKSAQADGASVGLVVGEPGIGKSRLISELARRAHEEGAQVLLGRCDEQVPAPHAPWIEAFKTLIANSDGQLLADHVDRHEGILCRLVPELSERVPGASVPVSDDPDTQRLLLFDAATQLLAAASERAPVLLVLEDAHWADTGSVSLLRHVVSHLDPDAPVLVVVTFRDTDVDRTHALSGALADLHRSSRSERISLQGLDESGILALLEGIAGHDLDREGHDFVRRLAEETEGNPFFISEVLRHMVESGLLVQEEGRWVGTISVAEGGLPEGVRDVVGQRLSRFSEEVNDVLRIAAVMGREFDLAPLAEIVGRDEDDVADDLDPAIGAQLVNEVEDHFGRLTFEHALVRQTLLEELSTNKRIRIHRRIAEALDASGDAPIDVLAHHYCEAALAGVAERAVEVSREAAEVAADSFAWDESLALVERAMEALDAMADPDPTLEGRLLCDRATYRHLAGEAVPAQADALTAADIARRLGDPVLLGDAGVAYQGELAMWARPGDEVGLALLREALETMPDEEIEARAHVSATLAHGLILAPGEEGLVAADDAVAAAERSGDPRALQRALLARTWTVRGTLPVADRIEAAERAIEMAAAHGNRPAVSANQYLLAGALMTRPDLDGAMDIYRELLWEGALEGWPAAVASATRAFAEGRYDEAEGLSSTAHGLGLALGDTNDAVRAGQEGLAGLEQGKSEPVDEWIALSATNQVAMSIPGRALRHAVEGSLEEARSALAAWMRDVHPALSNQLRFIAVGPVARIVFATGEADDAVWYSSYLDRFAGEMLATDAGIYGAVDWFRGLFAAVDGRHDDAVELVTAGHRMHEENGLRGRWVLSGHDLGTILLRRGADGDEEAAHALLTDVGRVAEELGMTPTRESVDELLG